MTTRERAHHGGAPGRDRRTRGAWPVTLLGDPASPSPRPRGHVRRPGDADRVAVVSGGNRGLGLALVRAFARQGMRVVMATRSLERGRAALDDLGELADRVAVRQLDLTDPGSVSRLAATLERQLGRCDALVNNAAVLEDADEAHAADTDLAVVRRTLDTNLVGTWRLTQAIVPLMRRAGGGRIVNVTSELASLGSMGSGLPAYRVSQTAVNALTRILADDLRDDGILVNACCPAPAEPRVTDDGRAVAFAASTDTAVWLATLPDDGPTGGFFRDREPLAW